MNIGRQLLLICLLVIFGCAEKDCEMSTVRVDGVDFPVKVVDIPYQLKYRNEVKGNWDDELRDSDDGEVRPFGMVCGRNATFNVQGELSIRVDVDGYELVNRIDVIYRYDVKASPSAKAFFVKAIDAYPRVQIKMVPVPIDKAKSMPLSSREEQIVVLCLDGVLFWDECCTSFSFIKRPRERWTSRETARGWNVEL